MTAVQITTDEFPELSDYLTTRRARGQDTYDEWWEGTYRIVTGPTPEHGYLIMRLGGLLLPLVEKAGLRIAAPVNIGIDKQDCRVPDIGIYDPQIPRTSPAFLTSALVVVEVLSPSERPREKMPFFHQWGIEEYLEIDLRQGSAGLWVRSGSDWDRASVSPLLGFSVQPDRITVAGTDLLIGDFRSEP